MDGWLNINKPKGITSFDVIRELRKKLGKIKMGHAGTLDPFACGVLPIACGRMTKKISHLNDAQKEYIFDVLWGKQTDTDDCDGVIINESDNYPDLASIEAILPQFMGEIFQIPPRYSACKVNGKRAYDLARQGKDFELVARPVKIFELSIIEHTKTITTFRTVCGRGTYVRALARDMAQLLNTYGHISKLLRTFVGSFKLSDAQTLEDAANNPYFF